MRLSVLFFFALLGAGILLGSLPTLAQVTLPQSPVLLTIPSDFPATVGTTVSLPLAFQHSGNAIGGMTFSIDFDQQCLTLDALTAVQFKIPPAFRGSFSYDANDLDSEIDVVIADYSYPIASLPNADPFLTVKFTPSCTPAVGEVITAAVRFSPLPKPSFGDVNGLDVAGTTVDGFFTIRNSGTPTPATPPPTTPTPMTQTPTPTLSVTPSPGTPSATPTLSTLPTHTPTPAPSTPSMTPATDVTLTPIGATPTVTPLPNTPQPSVTATEVMPTPTLRYRYYLPWMVNDCTGVVVDNVCYRYYLPWMVNMQ